MTYEEMQDIIQQMLVTQREMQVKQKEFQENQRQMQVKQKEFQENQRQMQVKHEEFQENQRQMQVKHEEFQESLTKTEAIVASNSRAIQAMLDQAATDRLKREEEKAEHERRMANLEDLSQRLTRVQEGITNLLVSLDEDRPTVLRKLNTIENKVDTILDRFPPNS